MKTAPSLLPEPRSYAGTAIMLGAATALGLSSSGTEKRR